MFLMANMCKTVEPLFISFIASSSQKETERLHDRDADKSGSIE